MFRTVFLISILLPLLICADFDIDIIEDILGRGHVSYIDSIEDMHLQRALREYAFGIYRQDESALLLLLVPYRNYMSDEAQYALETFPGMYEQLENAGYSLHNADKLARENNTGKLMELYPEHEKTKALIHKGIDNEHMPMLYRYACTYADEGMLDEFFTAYGDSAFILMKGFKQRDSISSQMFVSRYPQLMECFEGDMRLYAGQFINDSDALGKNAYYRGRYYESSGEYIEAMKMYRIAGDSEAYIRMIASAGNKWGRNVSDSLLLSDDTDFLPVLYHKAKALYTKGKREEADSILAYLASLGDINYYSVRSMLLINKDIQIPPVRQVQGADAYIMLYNMLSRYDAESIFNDLAYLKYTDNSDNAEFFAALFYELEMYHMSILYGYRMLRNGHAVPECAPYLYPQPYTDYFTESAGKYSMDIALLYAIARQESWFNADAVSPAGAMGIMQLMNFVYDEYYDDRDYFNVEKNIDGGARHISHYLSLFPENPAYGIMAYNAGPGNVAKWQRKSIDWELYLEMIPFRETRIFVKNIMRDYYFYSLIVNES